MDSTTSGIIIFGVILISGFICWGPVCFCCIFWKAVCKVKLKTKKLSQKTAWLSQNNILFNRFAQGID